MIRQIIKKAIAVFAAALLVQTGWADEVTVNGLTYGYYTSTKLAYLTGTTSTSLTTLNVPSTIKIDGETYTVNNIGQNAFENNTTLTTVNLPSTIKYISAYAFFNCSKLSSISLPEGLLNIGKQAFCNTAITTIQIPKSLTSIGAQAFCKNKFTMVWVDSSNFFKLCEERATAENTSTAPFNYIFLYSTVNSLVINESQIADFALEGFNFSLPDKLTIIAENIGKFAFEGAKIKALNLQCKTIGEGAFANSTATSLDISSGWQTVGAGAFMDCKSLKTTFLRGLPSTYKPCFQNCTGTLELGGTEYYSRSMDNMFIGSKFTAATLHRPLGLVLQGCDELTKITISSSINYDFAGSVYADCPKVSTFVLEEDTKYTTDAAGCVKYRDAAYNYHIIEVPATMDILELGSDIKYIDKNALSDFGGVIDARGNANVLTIENDDFQGAIIVDNSMLDAYLANSYWNARSSHIIATGSNGDTNGDNALTTGDILRLANKILKKD